MCGVGVVWVYSYCIISISGILLSSCPVPMPVDQASTSEWRGCVWVSVCRCVTGWYSVVEREGGRETNE